MPSDAEAYSAKEPLEVPNTSSPAWNCVTFGPTASTTPATSMPRTRTLGARNPKPTTRSKYGRPVMTCQSPMCTLAACTRMSTSSSPISGLSISLEPQNIGSLAVLVLNDRLHLAYRRPDLRCLSC